MKDLKFQSGSLKNGTGILQFKPPLGNYEKIFFYCIEEDQYCFQPIVNLTNSVDNSTKDSVQITGIVTGVTYRCGATTMKPTFNNVSSDTNSFNTSQCLRY